MYISRSDLEKAISRAELVQLTQDDISNYNATEPDWTIVDMAIAEACELADGYLMGRYAVPLEPVPSLIGTICRTLARHWLHSRRINTAEFPKPLQAAYDNAIKLLEQIRDGKVHIGVKSLEAEKAATERLQSERGAYHVRAGVKHDWSGYP